MVYSFLTRRLYPYHPSPLGANSLKTATSEAAIGSHNQPSPVTEGAGPFHEQGREGAEDRTSRPEPPRAAGHTDSVCFAGNPVKFRIAGETDGVGIG